MNFNINKKYSLIIITCLIIIGITASIIFFNNKNNKTIEVEAIVKMIGENYIIVEDDNGEKYSLETNEEYSIGDRVDFLIKEINNKRNPIEGTLVKIDTISQDISFSITDDTSNKEDTFKEDKVIDSGINNNTSKENTIEKENVNDNKELTSDNDVIMYLTSLNNDLDNYNKDKNISKRIKASFVTVVDFLFYDGKIKDKTFDELSNDTKIKVLELALKIDSKIDKYFPGYKEEISSTSKDVYTKLKGKITGLYLDVTTSICTSDPDTCDAAKEGLKDLKESFSLTWDVIKNAGITGLSKLKEWYEIWKTI